LTKKVKRVLITVMEKKFSRQLFYAVKHGHSFTHNKDVATAVARNTGKCPIEYIHPSKREIFLKAYPELAEPAICNLFEASEV
jgi:hypothetical protein